MRAVKDPLTLHLQEPYGILQPASSPLAAYAAVLLLFLLVAAAVAGMCVSTTFARRNKRFSAQKHAAAADAAAAADSNENELTLRKASEVQRIASAGWCMIKRIFVCSARTSTPTPVGCEASEEGARWELTVDDGAWDGYRSPAAAAALPLWQRKILMGERCELPRFSGLILYDECGRPLQTSPRTGTIIPRQVLLL
ncbi:hypothetical protein ACMD2_20966 [Ananas comosus]|uniref:Uncharacterized protein n=1 Tax=Ananas comosus TaxID=4615 RepID=A0A199URR9_ANACO|nr:hypothetical protein ACMD2_20966 [Ananas comosus]